MDIAVARTDTGIQQSNPERRSGFALAAKFPNPLPDIHQRIIIFIVCFFEQLSETLKRTIG